MHLINTYRYRTIVCPGKPILLLIIAFLLAWRPVSFSQQVSPQWILKEQLNANKGDLPQNSIVDLYFDAGSGFLWLTSEGGLVRYNGIRSQAFDNFNLKNLITPRFNRFLKTTTGKIVALSRNNEQFYIEKDIPSAGKMIPDETQNRQFLLSFFNIGTELTSLPTDDSLNFINEFPLATRKIFWVNNTDYLIGGEPGIYYVSNNKVIKKYTDSKIEGFSFLELNKKLYAVSTNGKAFEIDMPGFQVRKIQLDPLFSAKDTRFLFSSHTATPLLMKGDSVYKVTGTVDQISAKLFAVLPVKIADISAIAINTNDKEIYCGSRTHGLYIFTLSGFYTYSMPEDFIKKTWPVKSKTLPFNNIYSTLLLADQRYALTNEGTLYELATGHFEQTPDQDEGLFKRTANLLDANFEQTQTLNLHYSKNYKTNEYSYFWKINPRDSFLLQMEMTNDHRIHLTKKSLDEQVHFSKDISNTIWTFTPYAVGIYTNGAIKNLASLNWLPDSLKKNGAPAIEVIGPATSKKLLLTSENTFYSLDTSTFTLTHLFRLPVADYRSVIYRGAYCWITTYGNGYFLFDIAANKLYKAPVDGHNYLLYPHTLVPDSKGNVYIPTNKGLFRIKEDYLLSLCKNPEPGRLLYEYYDTKNGLKGLEFNGGCYPDHQILANGDILLPSLNGLVRVMAGSFPPEKKYPLYIESIKTSDSTYSYSNGIRFTSGERTQTWTVNFPQWSALYAGNVLYRLDKAAAWSPAETTTNTITLSELSGGTHTLEIMVIYDLNGKEVSTATFNFFVAKRYYEKSLFWILLVLGLIGLLFIASSVRNYQVRKKNKQLGEKVKEKTEELEEKNARLEESLNEVNAMMSIIKDKSDFQRKLIRLIGHDVMVPLQFIAKTTHQLAVYKDKLSPELREETIAEINTTSTGLTYLGQSIIQWIKLQENSFRLDIKNFEVLKVLQETIPLHTKILETNENKLDIQIDPHLTFNYDPVALRIIIHNLVMNANKFTAGGTIQIKCYYEDNKMALEVNDTGSGMLPEIVRDLNNLKAVSPQLGTDSESGWGLGYKVIIDLLFASDGTLHIRSEKNKGTWVKIILSR